METNQQLAQQINSIIADMLGTNKYMVTWNKKLRYFKYSNEQKNYYPLTNKERIKKMFTDLNLNESKLFALARKQIKEAEKKPVKEAEKKPVKKPIEKRKRKTFSYQELIGTFDEKDHTENPDTALKIAQDHLKLKPEYYTMLQQSGLYEKGGKIPTFEEAKKALQDIKQFIPPLEYLNLNEFIKTVTEEHEYFRKMAVELKNLIDRIPNLYQQDKLLDKAIVYLHYFIGNSDFYITEINKKNKEEAFGLVILNGDIQNAELGYINIPEVVGLKINWVQIELDLYWEEKTLYDVKVKEGMIPKSKQNTEYIQESKWDRSEFMDNLNEDGSWVKGDDGRYYKKFVFPKNAKSDDIRAVTDMAIKERILEEYIDRMTFILSVVSESEAKKVSQMFYDLLPSDVSEKRKTSTENDPFYNHLLEHLKNRRAVLMSSCDEAYELGFYHINSIPGADHMGYGSFKIVNENGETAFFNGGGSMNGFGKNAYTFITGDFQHVKFQDGTIGYPFLKMIAILENEVNAKIDTIEIQKEVKTPDSKPKTNYDLAKEIFMSGGFSEKHFEIAWFGHFKIIPENEIAANGEIGGYQEGYVDYNEDRTLEFIRIAADMYKNGLTVTMGKYMEPSEDWLSKNFDKVTNEYSSEIIYVHKTLPLIMPSDSKTKDSYPRFYSKDADAMVSVIGSFLTDSETNYCKQFQIFTQYDEFKSENRVREMVTYIEQAMDLAKSAKIPDDSTTEKIKSIINREYNNQYVYNKAVEDLLSIKPEDNFTDEERAFISHFTGYGGLRKEAEKAGESYKDKFRFEYFTPKKIAEIMVRLALKHGYKKFGSVLEPSCGIGVFLQFFEPGTPMTTYEVNPIQHRIAKILYPFGTHINEKFESMFLTGRMKRDSLKGNVNDLPKYDLVIGNPPYGKFGNVEAGYGEGDYSGAENYIDYFILRGLDVTKSGGLLIFVVGAEPSNGGRLFTDKGMYRTKKMIRDRADFIDGIKLWQGAFDRSDVMTEILVFRRK